MRWPVDPHPAAKERVEALRFRRMRGEDLPRVVEIERAGFQHPWSEELLRRELEHDWSILLVASGPDAAGGPERLVGFVVCWLVHDELHILNLAVAPEARRRGVARALLGEATERGRRMGAVLATLEVRRSNVPAIRLYQSLGYRQVGVRPNYYVDEGEDAILMTVEL